MRKFQRDGCGEGFKIILFIGEVFIMDKPNEGLGIGNIEEEFLPF